MSEPTPDADIDVDGPSGADDPMEASIRSDAEKQERAQQGDGPSNGTSATSKRPDPTDAPDLIGSALNRLSRFGLAGSIVNLLVAVAALLLAVFSPDRVSGVLGRALGLALVVGAGWLGWQSRRLPTDNWRTASFLAGVGTIGVLLVVDPVRWLGPVGWIVGAALVVAGVRRLIPLVGTDQRNGRLTRALGLVGSGIVVGVGFEWMFEAIVVVATLLGVANGLVGVAVRSGFTTCAPRSDRRRPILLRWIDAKSRDAESRSIVNDAVFIEGPDAAARLTRFVLMMLFASIISGSGVLADSTAVVIGAMLIAPLITPMMGLGLALVAGWPNRLGRSAMIVALGAAIAVATGALLAAATGIAVDLAANTQITSRSSPRIIDLIIAVAAGAAGAYALSRKDVSSSLPGVAVSIALVPPLSVVGVTMEAGDWSQAAGTFLLFLTNLVAIILAGGAVFLLTGVVPLHRFAEHQHRVRTSFAAVAVLAVAVVGSLVINGRQIAEDAVNLQLTRTVVAEWLGEDTEFSIVSVSVDEDDIEVIVAGPGDPPSTEQLLEALAERLGPGLRLDLQWTPRQREVLRDF